MELNMTPELCKAARALIKWQQADLARAAGVSQATINNLERGAATPRPATLNALKQAFEDHGIEFLGESGLRRVDDITAVTRHSSAEFIRKMNEDIYGALRQGGSELLSCSVDDALWKSKEAQNANADFNQWRRRLAIKDRILVPEGRTFFNAPRDRYRFLPAHVIGNITYNLYADRVAFILWRKRQGVILRNALIADMFRRQFNELWKRARPAVRPN